MTSSYFNARRAPTDLASGRVLAPGETVEAGDLTLGTLEDSDRPTHDQRLVDGGTLQDATLHEGAATDSEDRPLLAGDALEQRARELGIEGRSAMSADELRAAVAEAEDTDNPNGEG